MPAPSSTPEWVKHAVFYQVFPDRFASSPRVLKPGTLEPWDAPPTIHGFKGGDLLGLAERLDYLQDLGINAIYLNPIFQSASNHRYHTHDYYRVDPLLGGDAALRALLDSAHRRGIRIVLDGVFNHTGRGFFPFHHILECGASSPYVDWFDVRGFPLNACEGTPAYRCWISLPALPELNTRNPQVRAFIMGVARYWIEQGIDGWRLDVPFCIDDDGFWQEFREVVKAANSEAYIVGEIPWEAQRWLRGDQFDAVMNYQLTQACLGFFAGSTIDRVLEERMMGLPETQPLDAPGFARRAEELLSLYPRENVLAQLNLLDSHDMPRFLALAGNDRSALELAVLFQMTYPGAPCVYYGDEVGLGNGATRDPEGCRFGFPWDERRWDALLRRYFKELIALRKSHRALRTGELSTLLAREGLYAYLRHLGEERLLVILNTGATPAALRIPAGGALPEGSTLRDLLGGGEAVVRGGAFIAQEIPSRTGALYLARSPA